VTLSATSASTSDVREVIKQAQNEIRLCKRKTVLFIDEIHRFNKSQQVCHLTLEIQSLDAKAIEFMNVSTLGKDT